MILTWFKLWHQDYLGDAKVRGLQAAYRGILLDLWCLCAQEGHFSTKNEKISQKIGEKKCLVKKAMEELKVFFKIEESEDGSETFYYSARMRREMELSNRKSITNRQNGKSGGRPKRQMELTGENPTVYQSKPSGLTGENPTVYQSKPSGLTGENPNPNRNKSLQIPEERKEKEKENPLPGVKENEKESLPAPASAPPPVVENFFEDEDETESETSAAGAVSPPGAFMFLPCLYGGETGWMVSVNQCAKWQVEFPGISVRSELQRIHDWLTRNPRKQKKSIEMNKFVSLWLLEEHEKALKPSSRSGENSYGQARKNTPSRSDISLSKQLEEISRMSQMSGADEGEGAGW